jgi:hypothetical protein
MSGFPPLAIAQLTIQVWQLRARSCRALTTLILLTV